MDEFDERELTLALKRQSGYPYKNAKGASSVMDEIDLKQFEGHTPGPWVVEHRHVDCTPHDDERYGLGLDIKAIPEPTRGRFSLAADAALIAAAPELLNRLKAGIAACERIKDDKRHNVNIRLAAQEILDALKGVGNSQ